MASSKETNLQMEKRMLDYWDKERIFQKSIEQRKDADSFVFYEGPPTANGLPHVGHALGRTLKDIVARYQTMQGKKVIRKAGWDTHGLPVELGVEKELGISGKQEIEEYGVEKFIAKCKESVFSYEKQWREFTRDLGYWVDMDDPYLTMSNEYIESVWHILGTLHQRNLLYKGHRVSPYCPCCQTSLSSHEVAQGYKDVKDLSATVKFKLKNTSNEYMLGWTTTPWTLPANVALAVNKDLDYAKVQTRDEVLIMSAARVNSFMKEGDKLIEVIKGSELAGHSYVPPFDFVDVDKGHIIVEADFVTEQSGTGIVHIAPAYGEDDYRTVQENQLSFVHVVDRQGKYTEEVEPLADRFVKDCDVDIVKMLHEKGLLFLKEKYEHSYPHCWRCDSPLLYYASDSWFIKTTAVKKQMLKENQSVQWHPEHIKEGRFGNFLENMVDWNISRSRYWGTPLNVWECDGCQTEFSPKSINELLENCEEHTEQLELHKPYVDELQVKCPSCRKTMKRTPEVIDVWFDSGSMPFAQYHFPFENQNLFEEQFPADVVAEGIDQTRGWFYSLLAVSVLYKGAAPYKRVLATGHVLDEKGQKMSKSKGNALDPIQLMKEFGADALRWALIEDSAPWNQKRFSKQNIKEAKSKFIDTLSSMLNFYSLYAEMDSFKPDEERELAYSVMDKWILSRLETTKEKMKSDMDEYRLTEAARSAGRLAEEASNWYIRRNRQRFWSEGMSNDKAAAFQTLFTVLRDLARLSAPFIPFTSEEIHLSLTGSSVHLTDYPLSRKEWKDEKLERQMNQVLEIVELGRNIRNSAQIKTKQPLAKMTIIPARSDFETLGQFEETIMDELNVKKIVWEDSSSGLISYELKLNFKSAGPKLGKDLNEVKNRLQSLSMVDINQFKDSGKIHMVLEDKKEVELTDEDVILHKKIQSNRDSNATNSNFTVMLDLAVSKKLLEEGMVRDFIRFIQDVRKKKDLQLEQRIEIYVDSDNEFRRIIAEYEELIRNGVMLKAIRFAKTDEMEKLFLGEHEIFVHIQ
ncbi:isoleucine--tRNA ligase [Falsibacillus pallidus]|uniref:isoleucine--tRNA ligase n=1 Tax=Falsibacillus pallidus TaxID=493781 RepID=UPI003D998651